MSYGEYGRVAYISTEYTANERNMIHLMADKNKVELYEFADSSSAFCTHITPSKDELGVFSKPVNEGNVSYKPKYPEISDIDNEDNKVYYDFDDDYEADEEDECINVDDILGLDCQGNLASNDVFGVFPPAQGAIDPADITTLRNLIDTMSVIIHKYDFR